MAISIEGPPLTFKPQFEDARGCQCKWCTNGTELPSCYPKFIDEEVASALSRGSAGTATNEHVYREAARRMLFSAENNQVASMARQFPKCMDTDCCQRAAEWLLVAASRGGGEQVVEHLLNVFPSINLEQPDVWTGATPLILAANHGHVGIVKALLEVRLATVYNALMVCF